MPAQSPTMTHGDILSWEKKEGEMCHEGDVLLRVKTDKADIDVECPEDAFLAKIVVPAGTEKVRWVQERVPEIRACSAPFRVKMR